jgi:hypothetical protein
MQNMMVDHVTKLDLIMLSNISNESSPYHRGLSIRQETSRPEPLDAWPETLVQRNYWGDLPQCSLFLENTGPVQKCIQKL